VNNMHSAILKHIKESREPMPLEFIATELSLFGIAGNLKSISFQRWHSAMIYLVHEGDLIEFEDGTVNLVDSVN